VGLKSDGTVVAVGNNYYGQCDVSSWTDIVQVAASYLHTVGLKSDGTVVAVGHNFYGQCNLFDWDLKPTVEPGDCNGDKNINVQDVICIINVILDTGTASGNPDCNSDGHVNVQDVICVINKILGG
jgi:hypothetical protein